MSSERPGLSKGEPEIPNGVPGDDSVLFSAMSAILHRDLKQRYGTDDPHEILSRLSPAEAQQFLTRYGSSLEFEPGDQAALRKRFWDRSERIAMLRSVQTLQRNYNEILSSMHQLQAKIAQLEHALVALSESSFLNIAAQLQRVKLTTEIARTRSQFLTALHNKSSQAQALEKFGFKVPDNDQPFTESQE